jgi:hypothetical protein
MRGPADLGRRALYHSVIRNRTTTDSAGKFERPDFRDPADARTHLGRRIIDMLRTARDDLVETRIVARYHPAE